MVEHNLALIDNKTENESQLKALGLDGNTLKQSIVAGLSQYISAPRLAPLNARGSMASFHIISTLREQLLSSDSSWSMVNQHGQCLTVNSELQVSIIVTSGDQHTGITNSDRDPCTKNGKGSETKNQIQQNNKIGQTLDLFADEQLVDSKESKVDNHTIWILLYHFDKTKKEVRFEISQPIGFKEVGTKGKVKVSSWANRIHFNSIPFDGTTHTHEPTDFSQEVEFNVTPKKIT